MLRAHDSCYPKSLICLSSALFPTPSPTNNFKLKCLSFLLRIDNLLFFDVSFFQNLFFRRVGGGGGKNSAPILLHLASFSYFYLLYYLDFIPFIILLKESLVGPIFKVRELFGVNSIGRRVKT